MIRQYFFLVLSKRIHYDIGYSLLHNQNSSFNASNSDSFDGRMKERKFMYQETLEELVMAKKVVVAGQELTIIDNGAVYLLTPAVKFVCCETCKEDPFRLTGKYASHEKLTEKGAEIFLSSIIYNKHSYQVDQGYFCVPAE